MIRRCLQHVRERVAARFPAVSFTSPRLSGRTAGLAIFLAVTSSSPDLDREGLVRPLQYGTQFRLGWRLHTSEVERGPVRDDWLESLLGRHSVDEDHPASALSRARDAIADRDASTAHSEIKRALSLLTAVRRKMGSDMPVDLTFLLGYCYSLALQIGAPSEAVEHAEPLLREVFERDPDWWRAMTLLAWMHQNLADREHASGEKERARELYELAIEDLVPALEHHPSEIEIRRRAVAIKRSIGALSPCDPESEDCRRERLELWRELRYVAEGQRAVAERAVASFEVVMLMLALSLVTEVPDDLLAVAPELLEDFAAARSIEVFAARMATLTWLVQMLSDAPPDVEQAAFTEAVEVFDGPTDLRMLRLMHALKAEDCALGEEAVREAIDADDSAAVLTLAANLKLDCGDAEGAEAMVRERLDASPSVRLRCALGILLLRIGGRDGDAIAELEEAVAEDPRDVASLWALGLARALDGDLAGGLAELRRAKAVSSASEDSLDRAVAAVEAALAAAEER